MLNPLIRGGEKADGCPKSVRMYLPQPFENTMQFWLNFTCPQMDEAVEKWTSKDDSKAFRWIGFDFL